MTNKDITIENLKKEKEDLEQELQYKGGIDSVIEGMIYEIEDTIKKLTN
jgi:hypothetical protein